MILQKFVRNENGNISIIFAGSMIAIFGAVGLAVDYARVTQEKHTTQNALDASSLAAAIEYQKSGNKTKAKQIGIDHMSSIMSDVDVEQLDFDIKNKFISGTYNDEIDNTILAVFTADTTTYSVESKVEYANESITDFALAVDVSASMVTKNLLAGLRSSLSDFSSQVYNKSKPGEVTVSVAPFSNFVSFEPKYEKWLDKKNGKKQTNKFHGCFEYFPIGKKNALDKTSNANRIAAFPRKTNKNQHYCTASASNAAFYIDNEAELTAKLGGLTTGFGTNTAEGLTWAWRMLTPSWQSTFGESVTYPRDHDPEHKKVIILLTDGKPYQVPSVKGKGETKKFANDRGSLDFKEVCSQIKAADNIDLYSIIYGDGMGEEQEADLLNCIAGNGRAYWGGDSDQLSEILAQIITRNRALALSK